MRRVVTLKILFSPADDQPGIEFDVKEPRSPRGHRLAISTWGHRIRSTITKCIGDLAAQNLVPEDFEVEQSDFIYRPEEDEDVDNPPGTREVKDDDSSNRSGS